MIACLESAHGSGGAVDVFVDQDRHGRNQCCSYLLVPIRSE
jgi:hypothetical protein